MQYEYSATKDSWLQKAMFAKDKKQYLSQWRDKYEKIDTDLDFNQFEFIPNSSDILVNLPALSFMLRVPFKLQKPYLSKDDRTFHILDNPVRKDKVFQVPMVAPSSWKGALQMAMFQQFAEWWCSLDEQVKTQHQYKKEFVAKRISIGRIFGTEKGFEIDLKKCESYLDNLGDQKLAIWYKRYVRRYVSPTGFFSGRLYFYPTFFDKLSLEVINPHDRKKGTSARGPIYLECVPKDAKGEFVVLYVPLGKVDEPQVFQDLELLVQGIKAMLTVYGFGAKTSSGFGVVDDQLYSPGKLTIRAEIPELKKIQVSPEQKEFLNDDGSLKQDFLNDDGSFKSESQYKKFLQKQNKPHNSTLYKKVKQWYEENRQRVASNSDLITSQSFNSLSELGDRAQQIIKNLTENQ
ncbi:hypothetical protein K4A83_00515 [Spirulina subsalsa FACHB-351]|uniref:CRISPR type III-associated protein domain-containing protein n=1 Tax=Spirulina subsalsa FACHB-351 TaxID=234711 RepID=A0ABT3KZT2_9CYAN|nr:RAMP superfamily CRISPR-associated protein [Spirulina subsalsa]MCW6034760.1 hypothetical protein [Spirulina subsalsa FACHB-351]